MWNVSLAYGSDLVPSKSNCAFPVLCYATRVDWFCLFDFCNANWNCNVEIVVLCRRHQGALRTGRWRSLRKTSPKEDLCQTQPLKRGKTTLLAQCCSVSSSLLSLDHVRESFLHHLNYSFLLVAKSFLLFCFHF